MPRWISLCRCCSNLCHLLECCGFGAGQLMLSVVKDAMLEQESDYHLWLLFLYPGVDLPSSSSLRFLSFLISALHHIHGTGIVSSWAYYILRNLIFCEISTKSIFCEIMTKENCTLRNWDIDEMRNFIIKKLYFEKKSNFVNHKIWIAKYVSGVVLSSDRAKDLW